MKYFLAVALALSLLLPPCGSVFASDSYQISWHHSTHHTISDAHTSETPEILQDSVAHQYLPNAGVSNCCSMNYSQIGILENRTTEKIVKKFSLESFLSLYYTNSKQARFLFHNDPPTEQPRLDIGNYADLVGIIKRLD